ncbi:MAG: hypothetical protein PHF86_09040 [Candidatus Nanoarchaeia archaeon]|nr:hypothetical protein [Candidatus Nanoarchaeia archaeon]
MYIRTKRIKKGEYGYLVSSKWDKRSNTSKQKYSQYLGYIFRPQKQFNLQFKDITKVDDINNYVEKTPVNVILKNLVEVDLLNHNFRKNKDKLEIENCYVDLNNFKIFNEKLKPCVIKLNNGYLCDYTLKNLFNVLPSNTNEFEFGKKLARVLIESGISINNEMFVLLFDKIYKKEVS